MSVAQIRATEAARLLAAAGIEARVSPAGLDGEIAAVAAAADRIRDVAKHAAAIRALGFRYVALEIEGAAEQPSPPV